ncbi:MAG TPA: TraR/DksA C4-type zinc finger protein [Verrucomicrobiae bacterium]|nr:TraR/DksA C4-type zinc finger protein [Verrucomicrobiae bacterium]
MGARKKAVDDTKPKAATAEILGQASQSENIPSKWREHFEALTELREELLRRRAESTNDALSEQPTFSSHMADAGTDTYDRDLALGMLSSEQDALYQVDQALDRIRNGTYGICELTGRPIQEARLRAVPWTRFSADAEKQIEREGSLKRARLGPRETVGRERPDQST